jgi:tetratricopeptide (TPR) repeat protein
MRTAVYIVFAVLAAGQDRTPQQSILRAQELFNRGEMRAGEQELLKVISGIGSLAPELLSTAWSNLGIIYQDMSRTADAERAYEKAQTLLTDSKAPEVRVLSMRNINNLASLYLESGQLGKAERMIQLLKSLDVPDAEDAARIEGTVASYDMARGRDRQAEERFIRLLDFWHKKGRAREQAVILNNLGVLALNRSDAGSAASRLRRSLELWNEALGEGHPMSLTARSNYGCALLRLGRGDEASRVLESALHSSQGSFGESSPITAHISAAYSLALGATGRKKEAKRMKADADRISSTLAKTDPARHTVDVRDLANGR